MLIIGSWNETCGVSNLPIHRGDKVVLIFLKENKHSRYLEKHGSFSHAYDMYMPIGIPIVGQYNGYGGIEDIEDESTLKGLLALLLKDCYNECKSTYNNTVMDFFKAIFDKDNIKDIITIEDVVKAILRGTLKGLTFELVHYSLYQEIVNEVGSRLPYTYSPNDKSNKSFKQLKELAITEYIKSYVAWNEKVATVDVYKHIQNVSEQVFSSLISYIDFAISIKEESNLKVSYIADFDLFVQGLDLMRKFFSPQSGAGSPQSEYYLQELIANYVYKKEKDYLKIIEADDKEVLKETVCYFFKE